MVVGRSSIVVDPVACNAWCLIEAIAQDDLSLGYHCLARSASSHLVAVGAGTGCLLVQQDCPVASVDVAKDHSAERTWRSFAAC